jgi:hypothetical protein
MGLSIKKLMRFLNLKMDIHHLKEIMISGKMGQYLGLP